MLLPKNVFSCIFKIDLNGETSVVVKAISEGHLHVALAITVSCVACFNRKMLTSVCGVLGAMMVVILLLSHLFPCR